MYSGTPLEGTATLATPEESQLFGVPGGIHGALSNQIGLASVLNGC
jgi:hypothetical protein